MAVQFWLQKSGKAGNIVKNLSSSMANDEIAKKFGCKCYKAAVGESNVCLLLLPCPHVESYCLGG
jgi:phosphomannomutase